MKGRLILHRLGLLAALWMPVLFGGCATKALWDATAAKSRNEPAPDPMLHLYQSAARHDLLVTYQEFEEEKSIVRPRAFFLYANINRLERNQPPKFVNPRLAKNLPELPIRRDPALPDDSGVTPANAHSTHSDASAPPPGVQQTGFAQSTNLYVVAAMDLKSFRIYSGANLVSSHALPVYGVDVGTAKRIFFLPMAVAVDATIVGGFVFAMWWSCQPHI